MKSLSTELLDRQLRFDGVSEVEPDQLARFLLLGVHPSQLRVTEETDEVRQFNENVHDVDAVKLVTGEPVSLNFEWQLPEEYRSLDLHEYFSTTFENKCFHNYTLDQYDAGIDRMVLELDEIEKRGMTEFMRTIIYILDEFRKHNVVWGVGRGSSCACYLLFVAGLHVVDCVKMNVSAEEFFHD